MKILLAVFLLLFAAVAGGETNALASAPTASVVIPTAYEQHLDADQTEMRKHDHSTQKKSAALDPMEPFAKPAALAEPFGLNAVPVAAGALLTKWMGVEADIRTESIVLAHCNASPESCPSAAKTFLAIVADGRAHTGRARIGVVNRAVNLAITPMSDLDQWGVVDRWSAPLATFTTGRGDCEDYAIAKYVALKAAGVAEDDLRLVIVHDVALNEEHAVVAARLDGTWVVLDNRWLALAKDTDLPRMIALFVLNDDGVRKFPSTLTAAGQEKSTD